MRAHDDFRELQPFETSCYGGLGVSNSLRS